MKNEIIIITNIDSDTTGFEEVTLSDGTKILVTEGQPTYLVYDEVRGDVEIGSRLVSVEEASAYRANDDGSDEPYNVYTFIKPQ